ncbi:MAG TPA: hypothetical protein VFX97_15885 [Pyrinomonadaceae bacterium]|nr:hypothetical protein [Pyrinomonadaceae bacterium]
MNRKLIHIVRMSVLIAAAVSATIFSTSKVATSNKAAAPPMFCACCADDGEWYQRAERLTAEMRKEINRVNFSEAKNGMSGSEDAPFSDGEFELTRSNDMRHWQLKYVGAQEKSGSLTLPIPLRLVNFGADVHDGQQGGGGGPLLYKEWRFDGSATGTGVFKTWRGAKFRLVLQGRGNHCTQAEDFKHWNLSVNHRSTSLSVYGAVVR